MIVSDNEMRRFHRRFMGVNTPTDVLAFEPGDVVVSIDTAKRVAPRYGHLWDEELLLYICHGILHLMGYRDHGKAEKARMDRKQEKILEQVLGKKWRSKKRKLLF